MTGYTLNIECISVAYNLFLKVETVKRISIIIVCMANNTRYFYESRTRKCDCHYQICVFHLPLRSIVIVMNIVWKQKTIHVFPLVAYLNRSREHKLCEQICCRKYVLVASWCFRIRPHQVDAHDIPGSIRSNWMKLWCHGHQLILMLALWTFFHLDNNYCKNQDKFNHFAKVNKANTLFPSY